MTRHQYFLDRLNQLGMYDQDSDFNGLVARAIERMSALLEAEHHSGSSLEITMDIFNKLMSEWNEFTSVIENFPDFNGQNSTQNSKSRDFMRKTKT